MRVISSAIILVLMVLSLVPGAVNVPGAGDDTPALRALDVCHASSGNMSFDLPYVPVSPHTSLPVKKAGVVAPINLYYHPYLLAFSDERPPKVVFAVHS
jgi:hypothetical protein